MLPGPIRQIFVDLYDKFILREKYYASSRKKESKFILREKYCARSRKKKTEHKLIN
jgi:hypothetical protein